MGGLGSGRQGSSAPTVESFRKIDLAALERINLVNAGDQQAIGSTLVELRRDGLLIYYFHPERTEEFVPFLYTATQFGGRRRRGSGSNYEPSGLPTKSKPCAESARAHVAQLPARMRTTAGIRPTLRAWSKTCPDDRVPATSRDSPFSRRGHVPDGRLDSRISAEA